VLRSAAAIVRRDLQLALRQGTDSLAAVLFFVLAVILFPFGVGPEPNILARIAAGVIWVAALLASMLALERLFQSDYEDGSLELLALAPLPLPAVVVAKVIAHWGTTGFPLLLAAPVLAVLLNMPGEGFWVLIVALALGTPSLSLVGAIGAALVLGARRGGVLLSLVLLPLYIPVLIFGVAAVDAAGQGLSARPHLLLLAAFFLAAMALAPLAAGAALRQALE
jgi:heme exporter protein B